MKILHLTKFFYPDIGGIETVTKNICDNLSKIPNYTVDVVCFSKNKKKIEDIEFLHLSIKKYFPHRYHLIL